MNRDLRRRDLLASLAAGSAIGALGGLWPTTARAFGPSRVDIAEADLVGLTTRPDAWDRLLQEVEQTTSVEIDATPSRTAPDTLDLFKHPFVALLGDQKFELPDHKGLEQLSRFLQYGGFLLIDDTSGGDSSGFDDTVRKLCALLFPTNALAPLPSDHSLFRSFFLLDRPYGRTDRHRYLEGVTLDGVEGKGGWTPLVYSRNDLSGALDRAPSGRERNACTPGGELQRREAVKLGINLVIYSITTDYKKDQAHVKKLIEEHRLDGDWEDAP